MPIAPVRTPITTSSSDTNLLSNPGFEDDAAGWNLSADMSISTARASSGSKSLRFYHATGAAAQDSRTAYNITIRPTTRYTFAADFWNGLTQGNFYTDYFEFNSMGQIITDGDGPGSRRGYAQWETRFHVLATKPNGSYVRIRAVADGTPVGEAFVDNIRLINGLQPSRAIPLTPARTLAPLR